MTHYNPMKGSGYTEADVPPSQDLDEDEPTVYQGNTWNWKATSKLKLQFYGNERTMNLNPLILANVQGSPYFKNELFEMRTFHEVVEENCRTKLYWNVWWSEGSLGWGGHLLRLLSPLQALHPQADQEAGSLPAQPLRLPLHPRDRVHVPPVHSPAGHDVGLVRALPG